MSSTDMNQTISQSAPSSPIYKLTRGHSCTQCSQRKVKCDGKRPCNTCVRSGRAAHCQSPRPTGLAARVRDARARELALIRRLRHCESLLAAHGIPFPASEESLSDDSGQGNEGITLIKAITPTASGPRSDDDGHVITQRGHPRFVDNSIWNPLGDELQDDDSYYSGLDDEDETATDGGVDTSSPETLVLDQWSLSPRFQTNPAPSIPKILKLWQIFLDNYNVLVKLFHAPTVQLIVYEAVGGEQCMERSKKALLCAIYQCAVMTMNDGECMEHMNEPKEPLLRRYSAATQRALARAGFLKTTDPVTVQALTLFLQASRHRMNEQAFWLLTGMAKRLAQSMGLHREQRLKQPSPFEAEMRRRLWWQIVTLDHRAGKVFGVSSRDNPTPNLADTKRPVNLNDSDLFPSMKDTPIGRSYPTEMIFCNLRYKIGMCLTKIRMGPSTQTLAQKEESIDECEGQMESMLVQCNPSIPLHLLVLFMGRSSICQLRFNMLQAETSKQKYKDSETKDRMFQLALQILEYDNLTYSSPSLQRFLWHIRSIFSFQCLIFLLTDLLTHPYGDEVQQAWARINRTYQYRPELINDVRNPLCFAMGNVALKAWNRCSQLARQQQQGLEKTPAISELERQRLPLKPQGAGPSVEPTHVLSTDQFTTVGLWPTHQSGLEEPFGRNPDFAGLFSGEGGTIWEAQNEPHLGGTSWSPQQY